MKIVIKVGTQALATEKGLDKKKITLLIKEIAEVMKRGHQVVLVSSGAIGTGLPLLPKFENSHRKKIAAAVGQPVLMEAYIKEAKKKKITVGQILLLSDNFTKSKRYKNFISNVKVMLANKILPIINENDVMKRGDLRIGDNDMLSALIAVGIKADKLIMLTNQDGLFTCNPDTNSCAELIKTVDYSNSKVEKFCSKEKSALGRGGMITKVQAAKFATKNKVEALIGHGAKSGTIISALGKDFSGTRFIVKK